MVSPLDRFHRFVIVASAAGAVLAGTALAQTRPPQTKNNGNNAQNNNQNNRQAQQPTLLEQLREKLNFGPNGQPTPADPTPVTEARREYDAAQEQLQKAMLASTSSPFAMENELSKNADYRALQLELRRAQSDYDLARRPILAALKEEGYYKELQKKRDESQKVMSSLVLTGRGSFDWLYPHAMAALDINRAMTNEEVRALLNRPEVEEARQRVVFAAIKLRAMRTNWDQQFRSSDALRNAKADLEAAKQRSESSRDALADALRQESEYEQLRQMYLAELAKRGNRGGK